jgi:hypothetical protein
VVFGSQDSGDFYHSKNLEAEGSERKEEGKEDVKLQFLDHPFAERLNMTEEIGLKYLELIERGYQSINHVFGLICSLFVYVVGILLCSGKRLLAEFANLVNQVDAKLKEF